MSLQLTLEDPFATGGAAQPSLTLDRHGAIIGRSPTVDWTLPDPEKFVSSRHCEIDFRGDAYLLIDTSTNGTLINGQRLSAPHVLTDKDVVTIGRYRVRIAVDDARPEIPPAPQAGGWGGWDAHVGTAPTGVDPASWDRPKPASEISGRGAMSGQWAPPRVTEPTSAAPPASPAWDAWSQPVPAPEPASAWSSATQDPSPPAGRDIWGELAASNVVDWARGGFGQAANPVPPAHGLGLAAQSPSTAPLAPHPTTAAAPAATSFAAPSPSGFDAALARAAGLSADKLPSGEPLAAAAGSLMKRLVAGLVVMLEARTRAKAQMGAARTTLQFDGNNPLKFARTPEQALTQLLREPERGFMTAERAIEDAFVDLQAHQVATLKAMQGALRATLDRFSPKAIRSRAEHKGLLGRILPAARDAALWQAYEREFSGVAQGSDEAFMDVFATEFRKAYDEAARR